jgi:hypothetical protein
MCALQPSAVAVVTKDFHAFAQSQGKVLPKFSIRPISTMSDEYGLWEL